MFDAIERKARRRSLAFLHGQGRYAVVRLSRAEP
jgi:hypothetical protein